MNGIQVFAGFGDVLAEVALALLPLAALFVFLQFWLFKFPKEQVYNVLIGMAMTFIGLAIFLQGVYVGFMPVGQVIGKTLGQLSYKWIAIPIGFVLGFLAIAAEPAVRVLNHEVEKASGGYIPQKIMLYTLSIGVAASVALSMLRILYGIPLWTIVLPGYIIAFIMARYSTPTFIAIAFDSGGVATGPMTASFIVTVALGVATAIEGRNPLTEGFGLVALVALAPIISVLALGLLYARIERKMKERIEAGVEAGPEPEPAGHEETKPVGYGEAWREAKSDAGSDS